MRSGVHSHIPRSLLYLAVVIVIVLLCPPIKRIFANLGQRWFYIMSLSFMLSFSMAFVCRYFALKKGIVDKPASRKIHRDATPLLGGAAIFGAFMVGVLINGIYTAPLFAILVSALIVFVVGLVDDCREVSASIKLVVQMLCAALVVGFGIKLRVFPEILGLPADIGNVTLTFVWIIGITNAMNFFDGMDGLAAGLGAIIAFFIGMLAFLTYQPFLGWISVAMMGSCLGFLPHNFRNNGSASIFLGDAGSTVIGFTLSCLAVYGDWATGNAIVALASPILIFWIMIFDMIHITIERILTQKVSNVKEWIDYVGKDHLHHRLADALGSPKRSVLFIYLMSLGLGISAMVLRYAQSLEAILLLLQASIIVIIVTILERRGRSLANGHPVAGDHETLPDFAQPDMKLIETDHEIIAPADLKPAGTGSV
jgi:UDP-GlcNAc:undecaprenyl-phosphate GlcNAc-1-phosphate transferase